MTTTQVYPGQFRCFPSLSSRLNSLVKLPGTYESCYLVLAIRLPSDALCLYFTTRTRRRGIRWLDLGHLGSVTDLVGC